jgi:hypothetical protein
LKKEHQGAMSVLFRISVTAFSMSETKPLDKPPSAAQEAEAETQNLYL